MASTIGFIGKHDLRIDEKSRVTMPARFKSVLSEQYPDDDLQVVVALSLDKNLRVYPLLEYAKVVQQYEKYSDLDKNARRLKELVTGLATVEKVDAGGRIRLSGDLRAIARLDREVTCIGRTGFFDIWDRDLWIANQTHLLENLESMTEQLERKNNPPAP